MTKAPAATLALALLLVAPASARESNARWTLARARAYLVDHELALVDQMQADRPEFDVRFTGKEARSLRAVGDALAKTWGAFRYAGIAHDVMRGADVRVRFVLRPQTAGGATVARVHGPPPNTRQPAFPVRATFYYGWFPEAWSQDHIDPFSRYHPTLGFYDSGDPAVLREQIAAMRYAHISAAIYSWWGQGSKTDSRFPLALALARQTPFRWAVYYEAEGYGDPSAAQIHADLVYLRAHYFSLPAYLHVDGRPVVFAYGDGREDCSVAQRWHDANQGIGAYLVLTAFGARERLSFAPLGTTASTVQVAAGDVDGDGRPELIASAGRHVVIFRRDGSTLASFTVASDSSVAAADLDSDGKAEVITGSETDGTVRVFSIRDGVALERTSFSTGVPGVSIAAGDLNRDSKAAIVVGALRGAPVVKVFGANGTQRSSFAIPSAGAGPVAVAVGPSRIVTATHGVVHIFDANGSSTYPEFEPYAGYSGDVTVAVGDTNGDDYPDVITDGDGQPVRIFSLLGTQATQFAQFAAFDPTVRGAVSLAATDTNGNGTDEILTGAPAGAGGQVRLLYGFRDCAPQPNAWHVYDPTQPEVYLPPYEFGVSPGFARALVRPGDPSLDRDLSRWTQNVTHMALSRLPWQLVETFNEWGEGTSIESAQEWATPSGYGAYLDALHAAG